MDAGAWLYKRVLQLLGNSVEAASPDGVVPVTGFWLSS